jgi:acid phosphatase (class A)
LQIIPPPPEPGSPAAQADLDTVLAMQDRASADSLAHAQRSVAFTVFSFAEVMGPEFTVANHPETARFFKRLETTANAPKNFLKETYRRERPFRSFPGEVRELVTEEHGYSYPSGHANRAWLFALVLGSLDPGHRKALLASALEVCNDRVLGGMHYPTDVLESRVLAEELFRELMRNPVFSRDLESLRRAEWAGKATAFHGGAEGNP